MAGEFNWHLGRVCAPKRVRRRREANLSPDFCGNFQASKGFCVGRARAPTDRPPAGNGHTQATALPLAMLEINLAQPASAVINID